MMWKQGKTGESGVEWICTPEYRADDQEKSVGISGEQGQDKAEQLGGGEGARKELVTSKRSLDAEQGQRFWSFQVSVAF